jgi:hypothetical protein
MERMSWKHIIGSMLTIVPVTITTPDLTQSTALAAAEWDPSKMLPIIINYYTAGTLGTNGAIIVEGAMFLFLMMALASRQESALVPAFLCMLVFAFIDWRGFIPQEVMPFIVLTVAIVVMAFGYILVKKR